MWNAALACGLLTILIGMAILAKNAEARRRARNLDTQESEGPLLHSPEGPSQTEYRVSNQVTNQDTLQYGSFQSTFHPNFGPSQQFYASGLRMPPNVSETSLPIPNNASHCGDDLPPPYSSLDPFKEPPWLDPAGHGHSPSYETATVTNTVGDQLPSYDVAVSSEDIDSGSGSE
ncbi:hypothetical protein SK128_007686 [Halocaridina rubra]|uniref:Uncharacterized protein n=1 Tax=Halocaridina rubra TaxID=373956 RepID=A0AAN8XB29_HALRR